MREGQATLIRRSDYAAPSFWIDHVELCIDLDPIKTRVLSRMTVRRNPDVAPQPMRLDGDDLTLSRVLVDGTGTSFKVENGKLVLENLPSGADTFTLEIFSTCNPGANTQLSGLYLSEGSFFTQCEAEGFRRITYFLDRPDVMATYEVTLRADRGRYPVLLSNGNLIETRILDDGRHMARWQDPHRKPCYLFALVAGLFVCREQRITSRTGREHLLQIHVRPGDLDKTEHAMKSLMASVVWDEARFDLPLDLDRFMIVATSDFNMGAMENKGLNIFNTKFVLANQATATDADYANIESVVGHEYFHNWTGNRVTCRDWFQLSLKEGLTVFRDQEFSRDLADTPSARAVKRIEDVRVLRMAQFPEDAGPMAHPVRPDQYLEINNFYTVTIYEKGAEVVRMMRTLCADDEAGRTAGFARGMALYFQRHDGHAVTCDDFVQAIADANPQSSLARSLDAFKRWYSQAGTPRVVVTEAWDATAGRYTLTFEQSCPPTPGQPEKRPFVIPIEVGLLSADGLELQTRMAVLLQTKETIEFSGLQDRPVASLIRNFSAPVILSHSPARQDLLTLLAHDTDAFSRWEAGQKLWLSHALEALTENSSPVDEPIVLSDDLVNALRILLTDPSLDSAFKELVLTPPSETYIADQLVEVDPRRVHSVRSGLLLSMAEALRDEWIDVLALAPASDTYSPDHASAGLRALQGFALARLCALGVHTNDDTWLERALIRFESASNMTDRLNALTALVTSRHHLGTTALAKFYSLYERDALVIDKWFALQASAPDVEGGTLAAVKTLMKHRAFNLRNPNRARSLLFSFCNANPSAFHRVDGEGYRFWSDRVLELDTLNPQVAARLARALDRWSRLVEPYRSAARDALTRVAAKPDLSNDVREVTDRALAD